MAIDGEPKDGDYVRYIERLVNRGQAASATPASAPSRDTAPPAPDTLAARAGKRRGALAITIVALAIAWQALRMLYHTLRQPGFDPQDLVPVAFLLIFAGMLWRAARSQRTRAGQPPARLPPLSTNAKHEPGKPNR